jgi:hypothetical protein
MATSLRPTPDVAGDRCCGAHVLTRVFVARASTAGVAALEGAFRNSQLLLRIASWAHCTVWPTAWAHCTNPSFDPSRSRMHLVMRDKGEAFAADRVCSAAVLLLGYGRDSDLGREARSGTPHARCTCCEGTAPESCAPQSSP